MAASISDRPIRIGIVDDNEFFRCTLHTNLDQLPNLKVVAEAENGTEALSMVEFLQPDIVLMDISMPGLNGIEVTRIIKSRFPNTNVVVLTMHTHRIYSDLALRAGACRFLTKDCGTEKLLDAIRECSPGPFKVVGQPPH